ncbi:hypothetical protein H9M94_00740 [Mycoplasma sp. Pen4]|uniref:M60 family metallopeptidase n=1 Tax=Mycoplasma sp. Pen4 TaxID=640330 RepID=UPI00165409C6|nr:GA module-containing protein [Mycoplasma sp. Pen4]QNM93788.1 hypothetical protein H9M94_00740 [Mycoplasma sp. Pen4]
MKIADKLISTKNLAISAGTLLGIGVTSGAIAGGVIASQENEVDQAKKESLLKIDSLNNLSQSYIRLLKEKLSVMQEVSKVKKLTKEAIELNSMTSGYIELMNESHKLKTTNNFKFASLDKKQEFEDKLTMAHSLLSDDDKLLDTVNIDMLNEFYKALSTNKNKLDGNKNFQNTRDLIDSLDHFSDSVKQSLHDKINAAESIVELDVIKTKIHEKEQSYNKLLKLISDINNLTERANQLGLSLNEDVLVLKKAQSKLNETMQDSKLINDLNFDLDDFINATETKLERVENLIKSQISAIDRYWMNVELITTNNNKFDNNTNTLNVSINNRNNNHDNFEITNIEWYLNDVLLQNQNNKTVSITKDEVVPFNEAYHVYAKISGSLDGVVFQAYKLKPIVLIQKPWSEIDKSELLAQIDLLDNLSADLKFLIKNDIKQSINKKNVEMIIQQAKGINALVDEINNKLNGIDKQGLNFKLSSNAIQRNLLTLENRFLSYLDDNKFNNHEITETDLNTLNDDLSNVILALNGENELTNAKGMVATFSKLSQSIRNNIYNQLDESNTLEELKSVLSSFRDINSNVALLITAINSARDLLNSEKLAKVNNLNKTNKVEKLIQAISVLNEENQLNELINIQSQIQKINNLISEIQNMISNAELLSNKLKAIRLNVGSRHINDEPIIARIENINDLNIQDISWYINEIKVDGTDVSLEISKQQVRSSDIDIYAKINGSLNGEIFTDIKTNIARVYKFKYSADFLAQYLSQIDSLTTLGDAIKMNIKSSISDVFEINEVNEIINNAQTLNNSALDLLDKYNNITAVKAQKAYKFANNNLKTTLENLNQTRDYYFDQNNKLKNNKTSIEINDKNLQIQTALSDLNGENHYESVIKEINQLDKLSNTVKNQIFVLAQSQNNLDDLNNIRTKASKFNEDADALNREISKATLQLSELKQLSDATLNLSNEIRDYQSLLDSKKSLINANHQLIQLNENLTSEITTLKNKNNYIAELLVNNNELFGELKNVRIQVTNNGYYDASESLTASLDNISDLIIQSVKWILDDQVLNSSSNTTISIQKEFLRDKEKTLIARISGYKIIDGKNIAFNNFEISEPKTIHKFKLHEALISPLISVISNLNHLSDDVKNQINQQIRNSFNIEDARNIKSDAVLLDSKVSQILNLINGFDEQEANIKFDSTNSINTLRSKQNIVHDLLNQDNKLTESTASNNQILTRLIFELSELRNTFNGENNLNVAKRSIDSLPNLSMSLINKYKDELEKSNNYSELQNIISDATKQNLLTSQLIDKITRTKSLQTRLNIIISNNNSLIVFGNKPSELQDLINNHSRMLSENKLIEKQVNFEHINNLFETKIQDFERYINQLQTFRSNLTKITLLASNDGHFIDDNSVRLSINTSDSNVSITSVLWHDENGTIPNENQNTLSVSKESVRTQNKQYHAFISGSWNDIRFNNYRISNDVIVYKFSLTLSAIQPLINEVASLNNLDVNIINSYKEKVRESFTIDEANNYVQVAKELNNATTNLLNLLVDNTSETNNFKFASDNLKSTYLDLISQCVRHFSTNKTKLIDATLTKNDLVELFKILNNAKNALNGDVNVLNAQNAIKQLLSINETVKNQYLTDINNGETLVNINNIVESATHLNSLANQLTTLRSDSQSFLQDKNDIFAYSSDETQRINQLLDLINSKLEESKINTRDLTNLDTLKQTFNSIKTNIDILEAKVNKLSRLIKAITISVSNNGIFSDTVNVLNVELSNISNDLNINNTKWYLNDQQKSTNSSLNLHENDLDIDKKVHATISGTYLGISFNDVIITQRTIKAATWENYDKGNYIETINSYPELSQSQKENAISYLNNSGSKDVATNLINKLNEVNQYKASFKPANKTINYKFAQTWLISAVENVLNSINETIDNSQLTSINYLEQLASKLIILNQKISVLDGNVQLQEVKDSINQLSSLSESTKNYFIEQLTQKANLSEIQDLKETAKQLNQSANNGINELNIAKRLSELLSQISTSEKAITLKTNIENALTTLSNHYSESMPKLLITNDLSALNLDINNLKDQINTVNEFLQDQNNIDALKILTLHSSKANIITQFDSVTVSINNNDQNFNITQYNWYINDVLQPEATLDTLVLTNYEFNENKRIKLVISGTYSGLLFTNYQLPEIMLNTTIDTNTKEQFKSSIKGLINLSNSLKQSIKNQIDSSNIYYQAATIKTNAIALDTYIGSEFLGVLNQTLSNNDSKLKLASNESVIAYNTGLNNIKNVLDDSKRHLNSDVSKERLIELKNAFIEATNSLNGNDNLTNKTNELVGSLNNFTNEAKNNIRSYLNNAINYQDLLNKATELTNKNTLFQEINDFINAEDGPSSTLREVQEFNNSRANVAISNSDVALLENKINEFNNYSVEGKLNNLSIDLNALFSELKSQNNTLKDKINIHRALTDKIQRITLHASNEGIVQDERHPVTLTLGNINNIRINSYKWVKDNNLDTTISTNSNLVVRFGDIQEKSNEYKMIISGIDGDIQFNDIVLNASITVRKPKETTALKKQELFKTIDALETLNDQWKTKFKNQIEVTPYEANAQDILETAKRLNNAALPLVERLKGNNAFENIRYKFESERRRGAYWEKVHAAKDSILENDGYKLKFIMSNDIQGLINKINEVNDGITFEFNGLGGNYNLNAYFEYVDRFSKFSEQLREKIKNEMRQASSYTELGDIYVRYSTLHNNNSAALANIISEINVAKEINDRIEALQQNDMPYVLDKNAFDQFKAANATAITAKHDIDNNVIPQNINEIYEDLKEKNKRMKENLDSFNEIDDLLSSASISVDNLGYRRSANANYKLDLLIDENINVTEFSWYLGDEIIFGANSRHPDVEVRLIDTNSKEVSLRITGYYKDIKFTGYRIKNRTTLYKDNPLKEISISSTNANNKLLNGHNTLRINNLTALDTRINWYKYDEILHNQTNDTLDVTTIGSYNAKLHTSNGVEWITNTINVTELDYVNDIEKFRSIATSDVSFSNGYVKDIDERTRHGNNTYYDSPVLRDYGSQGFKYPAWNYNYEDNGNAKSFLTINGTRTNVSNLVLNERVPGTNYTYANGEWLKSEINAGRLKKHYAADGFYERKISENIKSTTRKMSISTNWLGYNNTGIYAVAGEPVEIEFSETTYNRLVQMYGENSRTEVPIEFIINQNYWDNRGFDDSGRISNRYPFIRSAFKFRMNEIHDRKVKIGTPFGGSITLRVLQNMKNGDGTPMDIDFTIRNGIKMLSYFEGITTDQDWDAQIQAVKDGTIAAPVVAIQTEYSAILVPFTAMNDIAYININNIKNPKPIIKKWNSFYSSSFKWNSYQGEKIALNYCNDVWGGAGAWGGSANLYAEISWASKYFKGENDFNFDDWGNYHEVNHNFENMQEPFGIRDHGWTNIPSALNLTYINDRNRIRDFSNINGDGGWGWSRLGSIYSIVKSRNYDWYALYAALQYVLGPERFVSWVKNSYVSNAHSFDYERHSDIADAVVFLVWHNKLNFKDALSSATWGVSSISEVFKIAETYEADQKRFEELDRQYNELYPRRKQVPGAYYKLGQINDERTKLKNKLNAVGFNASKIKNMTSLPAIDFVGNLYAAGRYFYDSESKKFLYNGDYNAPLDILAGEPYVFDLENGINSINSKFSWSKVKFESKTKYGGTLELDSHNNKKLIYHANPNYIGEIDEFDIDIIPDEFEGRSDNYVPSYKFRIKVRNVVAGPSLYIYDSLNDKWNYNATEASALADDEVARGILRYTKKPGEYYWSTLNPITKEHQLVRLKYKFIAKESGYYKFKYQVDDVAELKINGQRYDYSRSYSPNWREMNWVWFNAGDVYDVEFNVFNQGGRGGLKFEMYDPSGRWLNLNDNVLPDTISNITNDHNKWNEFLTNDKYKYHRRFKDLENRDIEEVHKYAPGNVLNLKQDIDYTFTPISPRSNDRKKAQLNDDSSAYYEEWTSSELSMKYSFNHSQNISYVQLLFREDANEKYRPSFAKIITTINGRDVVLFEGAIPDREKGMSFVKLNTNEAVDNLTITLRNQVTRESGLILNKIRFINGEIPNKIIATNNPKIQYFGSWDFVSNSSDEAKSFANSLSAKSNSVNDYFEYSFQGDAINIYGKKSPDNVGVFDVYIDGQLIASDVRAHSSDTSYNANLFNYVLNENQKVKSTHTIRIVNKSSNPLYISFLAEHN